MIKSIFIQDFALIDRLNVQFETGLNILTGQTGAGKSIIIGALNMILGERADTDVIRQGASKAVAEGVVDAGENPEIRAILESNSVEYSPELILRREIRQAGSRAFINDTPVTIQILKQVGDFLVDLHGQHDHQFLLREENHQIVMDQFEQITPSLQAYRERFQTMSSLQKELQELRKRESALREKSELYRFQTRELEEANLDPDEEEQIDAEMNLLDNAEDLDRKAGAIVELGSDNEINLIDLLNTVKIHLEDMSRIEPEFETYLSEVSTARISIQEAVQFTERYKSRIEFNPQRLEVLRQRRSELNRLQKKYGRDIPGLISYLTEVRKELNLAENFDLEIENLEKRIRDYGSELKQSAVELHDLREEAGQKLSDEIVEKLTEVGIRHPRFQVRIEWMFGASGWIEIENRPVQCTETGCDTVRFYISTNKGEEPKPLDKIASGGEVSRVMLALKSIIARRQKLPVMIFDEIDTGISGSVSEKVGREMRKLSESCQIIAITHQPQIASKAHKHYRVEKVEADGRTVTRILPLSREEHVREVAGLMSGEEITDSALNSARELIEKSTFSN
ncbi:MAG: DNA repair protein RecN [Balneolaceae bacterium]